MMRTPKILGLNTNFEFLHYPNFYESMFSSTVSLLDYDAVIIDSSNLVDQYTNRKKYKNKYLVTEPDASQMEEDFEHIRKQIDELLRSGRNVFIVVGHNDNCYCQYEKSLLDFSDDPLEFETYSFLPIELTLEHLKGKEISFCGSTPFNTFFEANKDILEYNAAFEIQKEIALAKIRRSDKVISFARKYNKGLLVFLPSLDSELPEGTPRWQNASKQFLKSIFELDNQLFSEKEVGHLPEWTDNFHILNESDVIEETKQVERQIEELEKKLSEKQENLEQIVNYKRLLTETGTPLENIVKQVLCELGFELCPVQEKRTDIIAKYGATDIVVEIKGVSKSAAEKHAAQLEKWAAEFLEKHDHQAKALLIVNGYNTMPLDKRTEEVFPEQMLKYCKSREQALITTAQLLCLFIEVKKNPDCKEERIQELLSTIGRYSRYVDYAEFITK